MDTVVSEPIPAVALLECLPVGCASGQWVMEGGSSAKLHLEELRKLCYYLYCLCFLTYHSDWS